MPALQKKADPSRRTLLSMKAPDAFFNAAKLLIDFWPHESS
jgi:hypothetical protein